MTSLLGHLYTTGLDAAKQGLRFKFAHLNDKELMAELHSFIKEKNGQSSTVGSSFGIVKALQTGITSFWNVTKQPSNKDEPEKQAVQQLSPARAVLPGEPGLSPARIKDGVPREAPATPRARGAALLLGLTDKDIPKLWLSLAIRNQETIPSADSPYHLMKVFVEVSATFNSRCCEM
jgi:hypothetical protein